MSNWTAPICYLVRQTMELQLKFLLQMIELDNEGKQSGLTFTHNLAQLWQSAKKWLMEKQLPIAEDERISATERLVDNIHAIDPTGDLFRFGTSKHEAFGRAKTYDRVGYEQDMLFPEFEAAYAFLGHWANTVMNLYMKDYDEPIDFDRE